MASQKLSEEQNRAIGERIQIARENKNMTQAELAEALGISVNAVSLFETGTNGCSLKNLLIISDLLDVSMDYLTKGEQVANIEEPILRRVAALSNQEKEKLMSFMDLYHPLTAV